MADGDDKKVNLNGTGTKNESGRGSDSETDDKVGGGSGGSKNGNQTGKIESFHYDEVQLPTFLPDDVSLWWVQIEFHLHLALLKSEKSKLIYVSSGLPNEVLRKVSDLIFKMPAVDLYITLKNRVLAEFWPTSTGKLQQLVEGWKLGNRKPTVLLWAMRILAGGRIGYDVLCKLFFQWLPPTVATILITNVKDLDSASKVADKVQKSMKTVDEVEKHSAATKEPADESASVQKIAELTKAV